jgi:hypothetical protein
MIAQPSGVVPRKTWVAAFCFAILPGVFSFRWAAHGAVAASSGDSGIFLFIGQQLGKGLLPYRDAWDNKGPVQFYINALALWLWNGSPMGVVLATGIALATFLTFAWITVRRINGIYAALFATLLILNLFPNIFVAPNSTEAYSIAFQAVAFYLLVRELELPPRLWYPVLQGTLAALLFQVRPNNAGVSALYCLALAYSAIRKGTVPRPLRQLAIFLISFAVSNLVILWPFIISGTFREYANAVLLFGVGYSSGASAFRHLYAVGVGFLKVSPFGASLLAAGVFLDAILSFRQGTLGSGQNLAARCTVLGLALFVIEMLASAISGKAFEHYFAMWLLPLTILAGLFIGRVGSLLQTGDQNGRRAVGAMFTGACLMLLLTSVFESARSYGEALLKFHDSRAAVVRFVRQRAAPADAALVWGDFGDLHFRIGLRPATRHFTQSGYTPVSFRRVTPEIYSDLLRAKPRFILECPFDSTDPLFSALKPLFRELPSSGELDDQILNVRQKLRDTYHLTLDDPESGIKVYELNSAGGA